MARTSNEFGGGEIVPAIEAITGIQAPVMADFVAVPFGTVQHEHGERRQIQNLANNLKSSSGIERIPFNGIDELDTEQGPNGETVHALNTGDSRIRFINGTRQWQLFADANSAGTQPGTAVRLFNSSSGTLDVVMGEVEITFFGTGLNILSWTDTSPANWVAFVDGSMTGTQISPNNLMINFTPPTQFDVTANRAIKVNQVVPVVSGLSAGIHTVRIEGREHGVSGGGASTFPLFGCEIINENAAITQQPGADFDGRVEALSGTTFPIKPLNTTISAVNSRSGTSEAFTGTTGARVLNYITSGGQFKQSFDIADEAPVVLVAGEQEYTIEIQNGGSSSVTLPTSANNFLLNAYGAGGGGGGGTSSNIFINVAATGGGAGGGGQAQATFVRAASTQAETLNLSIPGTAAGGAGNIFASGGGGTNGGDTTVTVGGTQIAFGGGAAGGGGAPVSGSGTFAGAGGSGGGNSTATFTGWTISAQGGASGSGGSNGSVTSGPSGSNLNLAGGAGGNVGGFGNSPLTGSEGQGGAPVTNVSNVGDQPGGSGQTPGGGAAGGGADANNSGGSGSTGGVGAAGRIYLVITAAAGLANTDFGVATGEFTAGATTGADVGSTTAIFGNQTFDTNRLNQEVIRRINFREFGVNNQFATLSSSTNAAFTLDDGTTTLSGNQVFTDTQNGLDNMKIGTIGGSFTLTFVGTGLDIFEAGLTTTTVGTAQSVSVDGFSIGTYLPASRPQITPIVSGLAYGTHTVRFSLVSGNINPNVVDFIIYGPKKPEIPTLDVGSLELSDYNIMADFVADTANNINSVSKGTLGKAVARECILNNGASGTARWSTELSTDGSSYGSRLNETGDGSTREELFYTFYGDAFSMRMKSNTANSASTHEFYLDGTRITRTNAEGWNVDNVIFLNNTDNGTSTPSQAWPASGDDIRFDGGDTTKIIFPPSFNMGLGVHTIRIRHSANSPAIFYGMEVGTPIHINDDNLKVGSEGLNNLTIDPVVEEDEAVVLANLGEAKAWINYDPAGNNSGDGGVILSSYNISAAVETTTNNSQLQVFFDKPFKDANYVAIESVLATSPGGTGSIITNGFKQANFCRIQTETSSDTFGIFVVFYGELIDE